MSKSGANVISFCSGTFSINGGELCIYIKDELDGNGNIIMNDDEETNSMTINSVVNTQNNQGYNNPNF